MSRGVGVGEQGEKAKDDMIGAWSARGSWERQIHLAQVTLEPWSARSRSRWGVRASHLHDLSKASFLGSTDCMQGARLCSGRRGLFLTLHPLAGISSD